MTCIDPLAHAPRKIDSRHLNVGTQVKQRVERFAVSAADVKHAGIRRQLGLDGVRDGAQVDERGCRRPTARDPRAPRMHRTVLPIDIAGDQSFARTT